MLGLCRVLNMPEYAWIRANMPRSSWMVFALHFPIAIPCLLGCVITYFNVYNRRYSLEENEAVFLTTQNFIFSIIAGSIWFNFCFRLNMFTSKISILLFPSEAVNHDTPTAKSSTTTKHWNHFNRSQITNPYKSIILIKLF